MKVRPEDVVDDCVGRMAVGESMFRVLSSYPDHAIAVMPALESARSLQAAYIPVPSDHARDAAFARMNGALEAQAFAATAAPVAEPSPPGFALPQIPQSWRRAAVITGVVGAVTIIGLGATAAASDPGGVREFLGFATSDAIKVEFEGTVIAVEPDAVRVLADDGERRLELTRFTVITRDGDAIGAGELAFGDRARIDGHLQPDNTIVAVRLDVGGDADDEQQQPGVTETAAPPPTEPPATATAVPAAEPTVEDEERGGEDGENSGEGGSGGEGGNSGSGGGGGGGDDDDEDD